jgi:hypothetical protein
MTRSPIPLEAFQTRYFFRMASRTGPVQNRFYGYLLDLNVRATRAGSRTSFLLHLLLRLPTLLLRPVHKFMHQGFGLLYLFLPSPD